MKKLLAVLFAVLMLTACGTADDEPSDKAAELKGSAEVATDKGSVNTEVTVVDGKITAIAIDEIDNGNSKKELGADYNMKAASPIGKEWFEQIAHLEEALVGTDGTIELDETGHAVNEDITSGCTINLTAIAQSVSEAVASAK